MESFFFGKNRQLFGVYHEAFNKSNKGIVICSSIGEEFLRSHRVLVILANRLAQNGFHVLRMDYKGIGNSMGSFAELTNLNKLTEDIDSAVTELWEGVGLNQITLIGLLLGANLALEYQRIYHKINKIIAWNLVFNGFQYFNENKKSFDQWASGTFINKKQIEKNEIFGYLYNEKLINSILSIKTSSLYIPDSAELILLNNRDEDIPTSLKRKISCYNNVSYFIQNHDSFWNRGDKTENKSLIPNNIINLIVDMAKS